MARPHWALMALSEGKFLFLDCQTTGLSPKAAEILEIGWSLSFHEADVRSALTRPSNLDAVPKKVWQITGLSPEALESVEKPEEVWKRIVDEAKSEGVSAAVIHYAAFEISFLKALHQRAFPDTPFPWPVICTYRVAQKICPDLPAKTLRAISGFLGKVLPPAQRAKEHVEATQKVWKYLVGKFESDTPVQDCESFFEWWKNPLKSDEVALPKGTKKPKKKPVYSVTPEVRKALPRGPGIYQMFSADGRILYIGKATCLRSRVASYFQHRRGDRQKLPELMTQVREVRVIETETALEAALLETDRIKEIEPFYNTALKKSERRVLFFRWDLETYAERATEDTPLGPFLFDQVFDSVGVLMRILEEKTTPLDHVILNYSPDDLRPVLEETLQALGVEDLSTLSALQLLRIGKMLKPTPEPEQTTSEEGDEEDRELTPEEEAAQMKASILRKLRRPSRYLHRTRWMSWMLECRVSWKLGLKDGSEWRSLVISRGKIIQSGKITDPAALSPFSRSRASIKARREVFSVADYDRVRVLMTELEIIAKKYPVLVELSPTRRISNFPHDTSWVSRVLSRAEASDAAAIEKGEI